MRAARLVLLGDVPGGLPVAGEDALGLWGKRGWQGGGVIGQGSEARAVTRRERKGDAAGRQRGIGARVRATGR